MFKITKFMLLGILVLMLIPKVQADSNKGYEIAYKVFHRDDGDDLYQEEEMTLIDKNSNERKRTLLIHQKDFKELSKSVVRFLSPGDIEGTGFLTSENEGGGDDTQHLYLPELGRARRIVSSQKDLRFVNTDFTYEDMQRQKLGDDTHEFLREEDINGFSCYVVNYIPKERSSSQYSQAIHWIDKESYIPVKVEFYNKKGKLQKLLTISKIEKINDIFTSTEGVMEDFIEEHKTKRVVTKTIYNQGLNDGIFSVRHLEDY